MISKGFRRSVQVALSQGARFGVRLQASLAWGLGVVLMSALMMGAFALGGSTLASAQTAAPAPALPAGAGTPEAAQSPVGGLASMVPMLIFFGIFYVLVLMPQRKRQKEQDAMIKALKSGDTVLTTSGFMGRITQVEDHWVLLELAENVRVKLIKSQITKVLTGDGAIPQSV